MVNAKYQRILIAIVGVSIAVTLFNLPMRVIDDSQQKAEKLISESPQNLHEESHESTTGDFNSPQYLQLKEKLNENVDNSEKYVIFADSLATWFQDAVHFDSALYYRTAVMTLEPIVENVEKTAETAYQAYVFLSGKENGIKYALEARGLFEKLLEKYPENIHYQVRVATLYVGTEQPPMKGIQMLKDIITNNPTASEARIALGEFMMTVQKFDKAVEQFDAVLKTEPTNIKALVYLVDCEIYLGKTQKAKQHLQIINSIKGDDPYLEQFVSLREKELNH